MLLANFDTQYTIYSYILFFVYFSGLSNLNVLSHNHAVSMRIVSTCVLLKRCRWPESKKQLNHCKAVNTTKKWNELYHYVCKCSFHSPSSALNRSKQITDRPEHFYIFFLFSFPKSEFIGGILKRWKWKFSRKHHAQIIICRCSVFVMYCWCFVIKLRGS